MWNAQAYLAIRSDVLAFSHTFIQTKTDFACCELADSLDSSMALAQTNMQMRNGLCIQNWFKQNFV